MSALNPIDLRNEKTTLFFFKCPKVLKNSFLSTFMGFMCPKPHFYGSLKPQNGFIK